MDHSDPSCGPTADFGGRSFPIAARKYHVWASVATPAMVTTDYVIPFVKGPQLFRECVPATPGTWQITTVALEYQRDGGEGALLPLPDTAVSDVPPGVPPPTRRTQMQLRVFANDGIDLREFDMDCNQSITIVAQDVCVHWLWPSNAVDVLNLQPPARDTTRTGLVVDAFVGASLSRIENAPGSNSTCSLTTHLSVAAGVQGVVEVPPYAQAVNIYQASALGNASVSWTQWYGNPNTAGVEVGVLPFIPGLRRTQQGSYLPNVTHLRSDLDNDNARFYTLQWLIRP